MSEPVQEVIDNNLNVPIEEAYRTLRTNIQFCNANNQITSIALTSWNPDEGKTTTSVNLAVSIAKAGLRTLLVDADMRKPAVEKHFISGHTKGLSNYLYGEVDFLNIIRNTNIENLKFISSGPRPPDPAEVLSSDRFEQFIETANQNFDMIIIDTPPLGSVIDSAIIAAKVGGCIIVIRHKIITARNAKRLKEQLIKANANILGVVLNRMPKIEYKSYYNNYNYYGQSYNKKSKGSKKLMGKIKNVKGVILKSISHKRI